MTRDLGIALAAGFKKQAVHAQELGRLIHREIPIDQSRFVGSVFLLRDLGFQEAGDRRAIQIFVGLLAYRLAATESPDPNAISAEGQGLIALVPAAAAKRNDAGCRASARSQKPLPK